MTVEEGSVYSRKESKGQQVTVEEGSVYMYSVAVLVERAVLEAAPAMSKCTRGALPPGVHAESSSRFRKQSGARRR